MPNKRLTGIGRPVTQNCTGRRSAVPTRLPSGWDPASERFAVAILALVGRRVQPTTTRRIAAGLRRNRAAVTPVVAALAQAGRLVRQGRWGWVVVPGPLCAGTSIEGAPCRRRALPGTDCCSVHKDQEPERKPAAPRTLAQHLAEARAKLDAQRGMTWWMARNIIAFLVREGAIERPGAPAAGRVRSNDAGPVVNGAIPGASTNPVILREIQSSLKHLPEARRVLERDDPVWIRGFDAGTLDSFEYAGGVLMSELRRRRTAAAPPPAPPLIDADEPLELDDCEFMLDGDDDFEEIQL